MTQEQENFYRHSTIIVDETKDSFLYLLQFHLANQGITLQRFIEINGHYIYHLCFNHYPCCQCPSGTHAETRGNRVLHLPQMEILFDKTGSKLPVHNPGSKSAPHCCCPVNPNLQLQDLDFTLARLLLVNFTTLVPQGSPERNALDFLVNSRNKSFAHAKEGKLSNSEYQKSLAEIEKNLLVLAKIYKRETETKQKLSDIAKQPLNSAICLQLQNTLLQHCQIDETLKQLLAERKLPDCLTKDLCDVTVTEGWDAHFEIWTKECMLCCEWFRDGMEIVKSMKFIPDTDKSGKIHSLDIINTYPSDKGFYTVRVKDIERHARLEIEEYFTKNLQSGECIEGDTAEFTCEVKEDSFPARWNKNGINLETDEKFEILQVGKIHRLSIKNCNLHDTGNYTVSINNRVRETSLVVIEYFTQPLGTMTCIEGETVKFECKVIDDNQTALWFKDGTEVSISDKYQVERHGNLHTLVVYKTELGDKGDYSVKIKNCVRHSHLFVQEYFTQKMERAIECVDGDNIELSCAVLEDNALAVWMKNGVVIQQSAKFKIEAIGMMHKLSIMQADKQDVGEYTVTINNRKLSSSLQVKEIPAAIQQLSEKDKGLYLEIIKAGTETRYYIRILIVGENGVGKTCLLRRLLGETIDDVESTDGVDIVHRCKIRLSDGHWIFDGVSDKRKALLSRIRRAVNSKTFEDVNIQDKLNSQSDALVAAGSKLNKHTKSHLRKRRKSRQTSKVIGNVTEVIESVPDNERGVIRVLKSKDASSQSIPVLMKKNLIERKNEKVLNETILNDLSEFLNDIENIDIPDEILVDCGFWDFAGQRHYYATHPIFLNPNAVHLLVANIMKDIKQITTENGFDKIGEYVDFWFDSVHSCRYMETKTENSGNELHPPVIVVCTGIDNCEGNLEERKTEFRQQLNSLLDNEDKRNHLRRICWVSNTKPSDKDFDHVRQSIFQFGKEMKTCGEKLPLKWIQLERLLDVIREAGVNILSWPDMTDLSSKCLIHDEKEIMLFLKYQHKVGSIIYFQSLKENIILNQKWLADAFRCFVSDKFESDITLTLEWKMLEDTGKLEPVLIEQLFQKDPHLEFYKHQKHLLNVMELFGIIVKVTTLLEDGQTQHSSSFYMPCMISKHTSIVEITKVFRVEEENCKRTPWLCMEFKFMPFDFFNHIICYYISKYPICTEPKTKRVAIYHGMGVFDLDKTRSRKFILFFSKNTVAIQLWQWKKIEQAEYKRMMEELKSVILRVKDKYESRKVSYILKLKCCEGDIHNSDGRLSYIESVELGDEEYFCEDHSMCHNTNDFFQTWFAEYSENEDSQSASRESTGIQDTRFKQKCHFCDEEPSVYWCHDCQRSMCQDCKNREKSTHTLQHIVQHVQDVYSMDYNFNINVEVVRDIKVLHNDILVLAYWYGQQLVTCNMTGQQQNTIPIPGRPRRIAVVDSNTVAVTLRTNKSFKHLVIIVDVGQKKVIHRIDVKVLCYGIVYRDNQLFVGCDDRTIKVMNMSLDETRTIPVGATPRYICGGEAGRIYYTDHDKLYCIDTAGNTLFTFTHPTMKRPQGITTDDEAHLLVISDRSNNVLRISPDGKHSQVIITHIPSSSSSDWFPDICYNSLSKSVVIIDENTVYVYKKV